MPDIELFINDVNACRYKCLTYDMIKLFLATQFGVLQL